MYGCHVRNRVRGGGMAATFRLVLRGAGPPQRARIAGFFPLWIAAEAGIRMSEYTTIALEPAKGLTARQELAMLREAHARRPTPILRLRLARLLLLDDAFDALVALLGPAEDRGHAETVLLAHAHVARETAEDDAAVAALATRALALSTTDRQRAAALALRGKAETRLGAIDAARATLTAALALDPHDKDACKRLAALDFAADDPAAVLATTDALMAEGAGHARLFAARTLAHARGGANHLAREAAGFDTFAQALKLEPPAGWSDIHAFNAALAEELLAHPGLYYERYGSASELTWRIDQPATGAAPLVRLLLDRIVVAIGAHIDRVAGADHPWARARPATAMLRSWCVITESDGYETWHVHQFGWLSGVYYVRVPDSIVHGSDEGGCLAFGLPEDLAGTAAAAAFGTHRVRPHDGLMMAFPSHSYHRTFPHGLREKRICLAFDLQPT